MQDSKGARWMSVMAYVQDSSQHARSVVSMHVLHTDVVPAQVAGDSIAAGFETAISRGHY